MKNTSIKELIFWFAMLVVAIVVIQFTPMILIIGFFLAPPASLTYLNFSTLVNRNKDLSGSEEEVSRRNRQTLYFADVGIVVLGPSLSYIYMKLINIRNLDWNYATQNSDWHLPVWSEAHLPIYIMLGVSILAYFILMACKEDELPPLIEGLLLSTFYPSLFFIVMWFIQISTLLEQGDWFSYVMLCLFPLNLLVLFLRCFKLVISDWQEEQRNFQAPLLNHLAQFLYQSKNWPFWILLLALPVLGLVFLYLLLFGQEPDFLIKAWTETSDWALSEQTAPPDILFDEHYLCTVGATGHRSIVKPLRMGERHGHRVVVNRQLQIANAFEQILEERIPRIHASIRFIYDRYGYPIARHIHKPWQADLIYLLMKPAEWGFLMVIYLHDKKPENRIALQYFPLSARK